MKHKTKFLVVALALISTIVLSTLTLFAEPISNDSLYGTITNTFSTAPLTIRFSEKFPIEGENPVSINSCIADFGDGYFQNKAYVDNPLWVYDKAFVTPQLVPVYATFPSATTAFDRNVLLVGGVVNLQTDLFFPTAGYTKIQSLVIEDIFVNQNWGDAQRCEIAFYTDTEITNTLQLGTVVTGKLNFMYNDQDGNAQIELGNQSHNVTFSGSYQPRGLVDFHGHQLYKYSIKLPTASDLSQYYDQIASEYETDITFGDWYWLSDLSITIPHTALPNQTYQNVQAFSYSSPSYNYDITAEIYKEILTAKYRQNEPVDIDMGSWLANSVGGFFEVQLFPGISIGTILAFVVGLGLMFAFLRFFAGG